MSAARRNASIRQACLCARIADEYRGRDTIVLDLTGVVSGPFATMFLADQGADVLKIEPVTGDITRRSRASIDKKGEFSALFISSNRGKRSLAIDVKSDAGREVLAKLVAKADVLVQNFRPGTMERLGLGVERAFSFSQYKKNREYRAAIGLLLLLVLLVVEWRLRLVY